MQGHHLILGEIIDFITGEPLQETHDEQYRQKLAHILVEKKGYLKSEIIPRKELLIQAGDKKAIIKVDFTIKLKESKNSISAPEHTETLQPDKICMIIKYGPGSLVTRHRPTLAASRLVAPYQIPLVVVTNGEDAEILDGKTGSLLASGLDAIPSQSDLKGLLANAFFEPVSAQRAEKESRILYAYEIDGSCPCDDTVCRL